MNQHQTSPAVPPLPQDDAATARLVLRYRPSADVLLGIVQYTLSAAAADTNTREVVETPNADVRLTWTTSGHAGAGDTMHLSSFEIIHAHAGWESGAQALLPAAVSDLARRFMEEQREGTTDASGPLGQLGSRIESAAEVAVSTLLRNPQPPTATPAGSQQDALRVARSLEHLADALAAAPGLPANTLEHERTTTFCELLRELGAALADHDARVAPGTSAATRQALRGGLPLTNHERRALRIALTDVDHAHRWVLVATAIEQLARSLAHQPHQPEGLTLD